ncbi:MAG: carbohydate-binding domain-containing protein [Colwellia sp.]|nr:carbohydate-binding domain-containing protein [Colwellia sp.]
MKKPPFSIYSLIILLLVIITGCDVINNDIQQSDIQKLADNLKVNYELIEVKTNGGCLNDETLDKCYLFQLSLTMPMAFDKQGWEIYFSQKNLVMKAESHNFSIEKINGELHRLYAKEQFKGFDQEKTIRILLTAKAIQLKDALLLPNFYVMSNGLKAIVIKNSSYTMARAALIAESPTTRATR